LNTIPNWNIIPETGQEVWTFYSKVVLSMWTIDDKADGWQRGYRYYQKKHKRELTAVLVNLETYLAALRAGTKPLQVKFGFIHPEGKGVVAIGEDGRGKSLAATRLYLHADAEDQVVYLITIGDKNSQSRDIKLSHDFVAELQKRKSGRHEQDERDPGESEQEEPIS
jgi:putative component of toxin-antitoxin plasmid stabilization module